MVHYLVTADHRYTIDWFLEEWAPELAARVRVLPYEEAFDGGRLAPGAYIFSDLDRLSAVQRQAAIELWDRLAELHPHVRLLNHPARALGRYDLLRTLHASGGNDFNVYRLRDVFAADSPAQAQMLSGRPLVEPRFPVYLREECEHWGELSALLHDWDQVREAASDLLSSLRYSLQELMLVEFCDTVDADGVYRKYTSFVIGDAVVARSLMFSRNWCVKLFDLTDPPYLEETRAFITQNPHAAALRHVARQAGIDYGRIDYAFHQGRLQVWEINTNPVVIMPRRMYDPPDLDNHVVPGRRVASLLAALDGDEAAKAGPPHPPPSAFIAADH
jgi:hypothetical protein